MLKTSSASPKQKAKTMNKTVILTLTAAALLSTTDAVAQLKYPATAKDNTVDEYFGEKVADPYRWLENDTSAATAEWVREENLVSRKYLDNIPMRKAILKRLKETANYEKRGMTFERGGKWYAYRNDGLQNQAVLYQMDRYDAPVSEWRVWLDPNTLSTDGTVALKSTTFSHDGKYMAYVISRNGSDWEEIYVKDVATGKTLDDHIVWAKFTKATWVGDGFYYSAYDAPEKGKETSAKNAVQKIYWYAAERRPPVLSEPVAAAALLRGEREQGGDRDVPHRGRHGQRQQPICARHDAARCAVHTDVLRPTIYIYACGDRWQPHVYTHKRRCTEVPSHGGRREQPGLRRLERAGGRGRERARGRYVHR